MYIHEAGLRPARQRWVAVVTAGPFVTAELSAKRRTVGGTFEEDLAEYVHRRTNPLGRLNDPLDVAV